MLTAQAINVSFIPPVIQIMRKVYCGDCRSCILDEFKKPIFELIPGTFEINWIDVEKLFEITSVQSLSPRCHDLMFFHTVIQLGEWIPNSKVGRLASLVQCHVRKAATEHDKSKCKSSNFLCHFVVIIRQVSLSVPPHRPHCVEGAASASFSRSSC